MDGANATILVWLAPHCVVAGVRLSSTASTVTTRVHVDTLLSDCKCSLLYLSILLLSTFYFELLLCQAWDTRT